MLTQSELKSTKACTKCLQLKNINLFSKKTAAKDGLSTMCKACCSNRDSKNYIKNSEKIKLKTRLYYSKNKDKAKEYSSNYRIINAALIKENKAKYHIKNIDYCIKKSAIWYKNNTVRAKENSNKWRSNNLDKRRIYEQNRRSRSVGKLSKNIISKLFLLQSGKCPCCEKLLLNDYHVDHIKPLSKGGENIDSNIQLLRSQCNIQKSSKDPIDFMQSKGYLI